MYSRTILLAAASVAGATNATPVNLCQLAVARGINPSGRVMGEILI